MMEKKKYSLAEIEIAMILASDIIVTSDDSPLGKEDWDDGGWTAPTTT